MDSPQSDRNTESPVEVSKAFSPEFVARIWEAQDPQSELKAVILSEFKECGEVITDDNSQLQRILIEFFLHSLSFVKLDCKMNDNKAAVWLEALLTVLRYSVINKYFNKYNDFSALRDTLISSKCDMTKEELDSLLNHVNSTYFSHYNLYTNIFTSDRKQEDKIIKYTIDTPLATSPLHEAHKKVQQESQAIASEDAPTTQERPARIPLDEQLKTYKFFDVDMETRKKVMAKVSDARVEMERQLQERQRGLEEKIIEIEKEVNAKKRKK